MFSERELERKKAPRAGGLVPLGWLGAGCGAGRGVGLCAALLPFTVLCPAVWRTPLPSAVTALPGTTALLCCYMGWSGLWIPAPVDGELWGQVLRWPQLRASGAGVEGHEGPARGPRWSSASDLQPAKVWVPCRRGLGLGEPRPPAGGLPTCLLPWGRSSTHVCSPCKSLLTSPVGQAAAGVCGGAAWLWGGMDGRSREWGPQA